MASRLFLHEEFKKLTENVYHNPPESVKMTYPAIKYTLSGVDTKCANDRAYKNTNRYEVIIIDPDPDSVLCSKLITTFSMCSFDRAYKSNNLNHFVYTLYY